MRNRIRPAMFFSALMALVLTAAPEAQAQQAPPEAVPQTEVTDDRLRAFTEAYIDVQVIGDEHQESLATAQDAEQAQALQQDAQAAMTQAVTAQGLEPEEYTAIVAQLNEDEELRNRFMELMAELTDAEGFQD